MTDKVQKVHVTFKGKCKWAQVYPGQERAPFETTEQTKNDRNYEITVECSRELFDRLKKAGIPRLTELREDEETGLTYIKLKASKVKGDLVFRDPVVIDKDGLVITDKIGNGSDVEVIAELAPIKGRNGKALRLKQVKVVNLVPYEDKEVEVIDFNSGDVAKPASVDSDSFF